MAQETTGHDESPGGPEDESFVVEALEVKDGGRLRVPNRLREQYDIGEDDVIHVRVVTSEWEFDVRDAILDGYGRFRIPKRKRDLYGVEDGDGVGILVTVTELSAA